MDRTSPAREYNKAITQLAIIAFFGMFGGIVTAFSIYGYNHFEFSRMSAVIMSGLGMLLVAASGIPFTFAVDAIRRARGSGNDELPPPPRNGGNDASDTLNFDAGHASTRALLISRRANNQLLVCPYPFQPNHWLRLVHSLYENGLIWSRDHSVRPANIFNAEITPGVSPTRSKDWRAICRVFENMGIIRKKGGSWRVTDKGWESLCFAAGLNVVL